MRALKYLVERSRIVRWEQSRKRLFGSERERNASNRIEAGRTGIFET